MKNIKLKNSNTKNINRMTSKLIPYRKLVFHKTILPIIFSCYLFLFSCAQDNDYNKLVTILDDINNTKTTVIERKKNKLIINTSITDKKDCERCASKSAIVTTIYCNSDMPMNNIDTFLINIKCGGNIFTKEYGKKEINKIIQCMLSLSPTLQMLQQQRYSDFLIEILKKTDNNIIALLNKADIDLGKIEKIDIAGFTQENNIVNYNLFLKRGDRNNRLDLKVDINNCKIIEFDL